MNEPSWNSSSSYRSKNLTPNKELAAWRRREYWRQYRLRQKLDPVRSQRIRELACERKRRQVARQKHAMQQFHVMTLPPPGSPQE
ncbi:hypothetical protein ACOMHN_036064 [Nucella lapillus]